MGRMIKKCDQPNCPVQKGGDCMDDLGDKCTHFVFVDEDALTSNSNEEVKTEKKNASVDLYTGREMGVNEMAPITNRFDAKWIVIVGDSDCGKTTLIASLFDLFQLGPFGNFIYGGSRTQVGFEIRCHDSRVNSGLEDPYTKKTNTREEFKFLHLFLKHKDFIEGEGSHLLLSDISGEKYKRARDNSSEMKNLNILKRADYILFMIDGEKLKDKITRQLALTHARAFINKALDENKIGAKSQLKIVVSKWDMLYDQGIDLTKIMENPFFEEFGKKVGELAFDKIASRPYSVVHGIDFGYGLDKLLDQWNAMEFPLQQEELIYNQKTKRIFHQFKAS
jgi:predicted GTPase